MEHSYLAASDESSLFLTYDVPSRCLTITGPHSPVQVHGDDPWSMIDTLIRKTVVSKPDSYDASFSGGFVGYFGYELRNCGQIDPEMRHRSPLPDLQLLLVHEFYVLNNATGEVRHCRLVAPDSALANTHVNATDLVPATAADDSYKETPTTSHTNSIAYSPGPVSDRRLHLRDTRPEYIDLSLIHISEPTRPCGTSRMPSSA